MGERSLRAVCAAYVAAAVAAGLGAVGLPEGVRVAFVVSGAGVLAAQMWTQYRTFRAGMGAAERVRLAAMVPAPGEVVGVTLCPACSAQVGAAAVRHPAAGLSS